MFDLLPQTVLAAILVVLVIKHTISISGKSALLNHVWNAYTVVASKAGHPKFAKLASTRAELVKINKERKSISAQDQYARWTKLNRQFDKLSTEVNSLADEVSSEKAAVTKATGLAIMAVTTAPIWFSRFFYRKMTLFYFTPGILPYPVEWCLALPFVKTGGVGLTVWMFAINSVLGSLDFLIRYFLDPVPEKPVRTEKVEELSEVEAVN